MPVPLLLDTDIGSDVDDALALALAIRHPGIDLRTVTTVSADTTARAHIAARLLAIAGHDGVEVAAGVRVPGDEQNWSGREGEGLAPGAEVSLSERGGVDALCDVERDTVVATIGMQSNLAAAVERDPSLVERIDRLVVMGGTFAPIVLLDGTEFDAARDWNLVVDPAGAVLSLNAGFPTLYVPCDVTFRLPLRQRHLDRLRQGDELCQVLGRMIDDWRAQVLAQYDEAKLGDVVALLHDPLAVACVVEQSFVTIERLPVHVVIQDAVPHTIVDPDVGLEADVVRSVDAPAFADWWLETVLGR
ncbi:MAG: nucleoside hydrolase [Acidimicrobiia bacterium]